MLYLQADMKVLHIFLAVWANVSIISMQGIATLPF
ncbi:hypothetical protein FOWG_14935 [Fusarium oxysporum f. sp. lycopersici MN25]|nr:hypothetical protein FOWG_14935 [Fusarium oxysporum f. sp. lycopersici MN25]